MRPIARSMLAACVAVILLTGRARAEGDRPEARATAAERFGEGEAAFRRGEASRAAELFEEAHGLAPHHDAAWNAAQAWLATGDTARAATWLAAFLAEAPEGARDRAAAEEKLGELSATLGRVDVVGAAAVAIDGRPAPHGVAYVAPGAHSVRDGDGVARDVTVRARERVVVDLTRAPAQGEGEGPSSARELAPPPAPPARPRAAEPSRGRGKGLSPVFVVIGSAATAGLAVTSAAFGIATERAHDELARTRSQEALDDGMAKQDLTNGFFWGAVATGALTGVVALWLTDWEKPVFSF